MIPLNSPLIKLSAFVISFLLIIGTVFWLGHSYGVATTTVKWKAEVLDIQKASLVSIRNMIQDHNALVEKNLLLAKKYNEEVARQDIRYIEIEKEVVVYERQQDANPTPSECFDSEWVRIYDKSGMPFNP